jgi:hypothetical protein
MRLAGEGHLNIDLFLQTTYVISGTSTAVRTNRTWGSDDVTRPTN